MTGSQCLPLPPSAPPTIIPLPLLPRLLLFLLIFLFLLLRLRLLLLSLPLVQLRFWRTWSLPVVLLLLLLST